jgi:tetratricopeptide (TPR) repeat protein
MRTTQAPAIAMKRTILLITVTLVICVQAFALSSFPPDMLANKTLAERWFYLDLIYQKFMPVEDSIRFFARAEEIRQLGKETGDRDLELEADLLELNFITQNTFDNNKRCINGLNKLLAIAKDENNTILLARIHHLAGDYYWRTNNERAFEHLLAEYELVKSLTTEQYPPKQKSLFMLGNCYWFFRDYTNAMRYMTEAAATDIFSENLYYTLQSTNTVGLCHQQLGNLDSADYYFNRANSIAVTVGNDAWDGITSGNIGYDLYLRQQYDNALPMLQKDLDLSVKRSDYGCASGSLIIIAEINLAKGNAALAQKQAHQAREWIQSSGEYSRLKTYYALMNKLQQQKGNPALAKAYGDSSLMVQENLEAKLAAINSLRIQQKAELEKEREAAERRQKLTAIITAVLALVAGGVIAVSVVRLILQFRSSGLRA